MTKFDGLRANSYSRKMLVVKIKMPKAQKSVS